MNKQYDLAVYIGRFQPMHNGHNYVMQKANKIADKVLVLVGSANASISPKNPFTFEERAHMITMVNSTVEIEPLNDYIYELNQWLTDVQDIVNLYSNSNKKICIIGHAKDATSYYLKFFPQWDFIDVDHHEVIDATHIRDLMYSKKMTFIKGAVDPVVFREINMFLTTKTYTHLVEEYDEANRYIASWANSPFPPTFNTVDAVVIQSGHILLVKRKFSPGKGLYALPGGFIDANESQEDAVIRELREETGIKVPEPVLRGSIKKEKTFSSPNRSARGRTFTQAYLIQLDDSQPIPKVKGGDDAEWAGFITLAQFYDMPREMFEDHYHIARKLADNM